MMWMHPRLQTLSRLIDGELSHRRGERVRRHVGRCARCAARVAAMEALPVALYVPEPRRERMRSELLTRLPEPAWAREKGVEKAGAGAAAGVAGVCGEVEAVLGLAVVIRDDTPEPVDLFPGMAIRRGDTLRALGDSMALVRMNDGSAFYLNRGTEATFEKGRFNISLGAGELFAMMKPQPHPFRLWTPAATLEVLGTEFDAKVSEDKTMTELSVLRGRVAYENKVGRTTVEKRRQVAATATKKPEPRPLTDSARVASWTSSLQASDRRDRRGGAWYLWIAGIFMVLAMVLVLSGVFRARSGQTSAASPGAGFTPSDEMFQKFANGLREKPSASERGKLREFFSAYALAPGENARFLPAPFSEGRMVFYRLNDPRQAQAVPEGPSIFYLKWSDAETLRSLGGTYGDNMESANLSSALSITAKVPSFKTQIAPELPGIPVGDFVIRQDASPEEKVQGLLKAINARMNLSLKAEWRQVSRRVIVARGPLALKPLPDSGHDVEIYGQRRDPQPYGGGSGSAPSFLSWLGEFLQQYIVDETDIPTHVSLRWHDNYRSEAAKTPDLVLKNVAAQTGLTFTWEQRNVPVLFVENDPFGVVGASSGPVAASTVNVTPTRVVSDAALDLFIKGLPKAPGRNEREALRMFLAAILPAPGEVFKVIPPPGSPQRQQFVEIVHGKGTWPDATPAALFFYRIPGATADRIVLTGSSHSGFTLRDLAWRIWKFDSQRVIGPKEALETRFQGDVVFTGGTSQEQLAEETLQALRRHFSYPWRGEWSEKPREVIIARGTWNPKPEGKMPSGHPMFLFYTNEARDGGPGGGIDFASFFNTMGDYTGHPIVVKLDHEAPKEAPMSYQVTLPRSESDDPKTNPVALASFLEKMKRQTGLEFSVETRPMRVYELLPDPITEPAR